MRESMFCAGGPVHDVPVDSAIRSSIIDATKDDGVAADLLPLFEILDVCDLGLHVS